MTCSGEKWACPAPTGYPDITDVTPVCVPCEGIGYKAPFRKEIPFQLNFIVQWYIEKLEHEKKLLLSYFDFDGTIEVKDLDRHKLFLRRIRLCAVKKDDLFVGNKLLVLGRQMVVLDYCDDQTREYCEPKCERACLFIRPEVLDKQENLPCIIQRLERCFKILRAKIFTIPQALAYELSDEYKVDPEKFLLAVGSLDGRKAAIFYVMGENAIEKMTNLVGEEKDPKDALLKYHKSLKALYGVDDMRNGFIFPENKECVITLGGKFFADCPSCVIPGYFEINGNSTLCLIKPHIMKEGRAGIVLADIVASGFEIVTLGVYWLNRRQAEDFYEIYKRIFVEAEFMAMVDELAVGPCMAVELVHKGCPIPYACDDNTVVERFRCCCGPPDADLARKVRPGSLRAKHGLTKIQNAIHCTELREDACSELEFFFKIMEHKCNGVKSVTADLSSQYMEGGPC